MKNLFMISILTVPTLLSPLRAEETIEDILNGNEEMITQEEIGEAEEWEFDHDRPDWPNRPDRPDRPDRPGRRYMFLGCFEHRRYCLRTASFYGYGEAYAELDRRCPPRRAWACYVPRRRWY